MEKNFLERNIEKEKKLKDYWKVSNNNLYGKVRHIKKDRYTLTLIKKSNGEMLFYPNGDKVSIFFIDKSEILEDGQFYKFQWTIANRKDPNVFKIKLSPNNEFIKLTGHSNILQKNKEPNNISRLLTNNKNMDIKSFANELYSSALEEAKKNDTSIDIELARSILDIMSECGEISTYELCQFKKGHAMLTAYSYNEDMESLDLFLFSKVSMPTSKIDVETVQGKYSSLSDFYREALRNNPFFGAELDKEVKSAICLINENIEIDFYLNYKAKIQCLRVEDENPKIDAYFAIMPGNILAKVYEQYKQTLLEGNVRLFLQIPTKSIVKSVRL